MNSEHQKDDFNKKERLELETLCIICNSATRLINNKSGRREVMRAISILRYYSDSMYSKIKIINKSKNKIKN